MLLKASVRLPTLSSLHYLLFSETFAEAFLILLTSFSPETAKTTSTREKICSGQSYKASTIVIYDSRVIPDLKIPHITTLES